MAHRHKSQHIVTVSPLMFSITQVSQSHSNVTCSNGTIKPPKVYDYIRTAQLNELLKHISDTVKAALS